MSVVITWALLTPLEAVAEDASEEQPYWKLSGKKLNRGLTNAALGWVELPVGIKEVGEDHGVGAAATWGVLHGFGRAIQRTAVGIFEIITFPIGVPENFGPILNDEILGLRDKEKS